MLLTKRSHQSTIFQTFQCSNKRSPITSCHFWNLKVRVCSHFTSMLSVKKDNSYVFFSLNIIVWTSKAHRSDIFRLLSGCVKIHQIYHVINEITSQFFFKLCITLPCHERLLFRTCLAGNLYDLDKRSSSKCKI